MASNRDPIFDHPTPPKPQSTHSAPQSSVGATHRKHPHQGRRSPVECFLAST